VSGIVGAGGNVGAVCYAQFLLRSDLHLEDCFFYFGFVVAALGTLGLSIRFNQATEEQAKADFDSSSELARAS
jgi:NNP family nitrate/nitrite transporter-like MFS transporter